MNYQEPGILLYAFEIKAGMVLCDHAASGGIK
jgi:hypothetical protein